MGTQLKVKGEQSSRFKGGEGKERDRKEWGRYVGDEDRERMCKEVEGDVAWP